MISFIIATYNGEKYLRDTVKSALGQKNCEVEVIIIDDGSSDNSVDVACQLEKEDCRVHAYKNDTNIGFCKTVNRWVRIALGDFIVVLDQDDILAENHCENALKLFDDDTVIVFNDHYLINSEGEIFDTDTHCLHRDILLQDLISSNKIPVPGLMMKKESLVQVGGYPELKEFPNYGEYNTWIRMALIGKIKFCKDNIAFYRRHESNMTNNFEDNEIKKRLTKYSLVCKKQLINCKQLDVKSKLKLLYCVLRDYKVLLFKR